MEWSTIILQSKQSKQNINSARRIKCITYIPVYIYEIILYSTHFYITWEMGWFEHFNSIAGLRFFNRLDDNL